jgi:hypothetical protein
VRTPNLSKKKWTFLLRHDSIEQMPGHAIIDHKMEDSHCTRLKTGFSEKASLRIEIIGFKTAHERRFIGSETDNELQFNWTKTSLHPPNAGG